MSSKWVSNKFVKKSPVGGYDEKLELQGTTEAIHDRYGRKAMNERGMIVTGALCVISLILVMIMVVNARVTEMANEIGFLRECVIELNVALEDHEYEAWMNSPVDEDEDDPFVIIN